MEMVGGAMDLGARMVAEVKAGGARVKVEGAERVVVEGVVVVMGVMPVVWVVQVVEL